VLAWAEALLGQEARDPLNELEQIESHALGSAVLLGGGRSALVGGAACFEHPLIPITELNRAIPAEPTVDVTAISAWFGGRHAVSVTGERSELARELQERGYERVSTWMKFVRDATRAPPVKTDLRIEETLDAALFGSLVAEGSSIPAGASGSLAAIVGAPGWHCFIAWAGDEPAGSGALYLDGATAWIGVGSTRPSMRRRGVQTALLATRIEAARAAGATRMATETGEPTAGPPDQSYRNILRAGFREAYPRANWASPS
jgi:GNAT superfamily N-acetyltransferase